MGRQFTWPEIRTAILALEEGYRVAEVARLIDRTPETLTRALVKLTGKPALWWFHRGVMARYSKTPRYWREDARAEAVGVHPRTLRRIKAKHRKGDLS